MLSVPLFILIQTTAQNEEIISLPWGFKPQATWFWSSTKPSILLLPALMLYSSTEYKVKWRQRTEYVRNTDDLPVIIAFDSLTKRNKLTVKEKFPSIIIRTTN